MMLAARLTVAWHRDRWEARARRLAEKWGWPQAWLQEFQDYLNEPRMTPEEFWVRYTLKRMEATRRWFLDRQLTEAEAHRFYLESDYLLWRNLVHRRHSAWRRVLVTMQGPVGRLLEFGCGVAPVTTWVRRRRREWSYALEDIPDSAHLRYAAWRVGPQKPAPQYEVITALDVFEHLADPEKTARQVVERLAPGGYLHWNFVSNPRRNDLDLATEEQEAATIAYLTQALTLIWERAGNRVSRQT